MTLSTGILIARKCNRNLDQAYHTYDRIIDRYIHPKLRALVEKVTHIMDESLGLISLMGLFYGVLRLIRAPAEATSTLIVASLISLGADMLYEAKVYPWDFLSRVQIPNAIHSIPERQTVVRTLRQALNSGQTPVLVGPPGCGKTTLVQELARAYPERHFYTLNYAKMASTIDGLFFARFINMIEQAIFRSQYVTIFIDEIHQLPQKFRDALKFYADHKAISIIGASTQVEYDRLAGEDDAFCRRLRRVDVQTLPPAENTPVIQRHYPRASRPVIDALVALLTAPEYRALPAVALKFFENLSADGVSLESLTPLQLPQYIARYQRDLTQPRPTATLNTLQALLASRLQQLPQGAA